MKTISELITKLKEHYGHQMHVHYVHPLLYLVCVDEKFQGLEPETRTARLSDDIKVPVSELSAIFARGIIQVVLVTPTELKAEYGFLTATDAGQHWLSWYSRPTTAKAQALAKLEGPRALHFYGFKGGQARSTVLVLVAKALADAGARVLIVDADIEAPSLDTFFDVASDDPASTLMGLCGWSTEISPIARVYVGRPSSGTIDLLACRPRLDSYDMDFAGFLLGTAVDARLLQTASEKLRSFASSATTEGGYRYDIALFDHRTGLAPSVLPIMEGWPGPAVIFLRPDGMARHVERSTVLRALLSYDEETPGAFVSFSLDPKETVESAQETYGKFIERLLESLSDAMTGPDSPDSVIDPTVLDRYWVLWHHDPAILARAAPNPADISSLNQAALSQLQEVLGLSTLRPTQVPIEDAVLTKSGATDQGVFILTSDVERLFSVDSKFLYIFGRKGTGKTRLLRELFSRKLGEPLLVAQDFDAAGLQSGGTAFNELLQACGGNFEAFWWALLHAALSQTNAALPLAQRVSAVAAMLPPKFAEFSSPQSIEAEIAFSLKNHRRVFLIDGVETAVPAAKLREFVEALFRFLGTVQYSRAIANAVTIRLFLRSDLYKSAAQNVEQQIEGSVMHLRWDRTSILNFAVARMASLGWFRQAFPKVVDKIDLEIPLIAKGDLSDADAESLLLEVFPKSLERNKIKTTTFFTTYFSDAGGESESRASFYPRLFDGFLREIDATAPHRRSERPAVKDGRLNSPFVLEAYDVASAAFIDEVRTELYNLLDFVPEDSANREAIDRFIEAFSGLSTPFVVETIIDELVSRTGLSKDKAREALNRMRQLGIFEDRPGYPGFLRTGRLFKSGLKMKYVRS